MREVTLSETMGEWEGGCRLWVCYFMCFDFHSGFPFVFGSNFLVHLTSLPVFNHFLPFWLSLPFLFSLTCVLLTWWAYIVLCVSLLIGHFVACSCLALMLFFVSMFWTGFIFYCHYFWPLSMYLLYQMCLHLGPKITCFSVWDARHSVYLSIEISVSEKVISNVFLKHSAISIPVETWVTQVDLLGALLWFHTGSQLQQLRVNCPFNQ